MGFKIVLAVCVMIGVASAIPGPAGPGGPWGGWGGVGAGGAGGPWGGWGGFGAGGAGGPWGGWGGVGAGGAGPAALAANPWIPPWISTAPWLPQWGPCTTVGTSCLDCKTKLVCTKMGGLQRACADPTLPHCNLGECSATPSAECAVPAVPADVAV